MILFWLWVGMMGVLFILSEWGRRLEGTSSAREAALRRLEREHARGAIDRAEFFRRKASLD